jgi:hypothetical protein
LLDTSRPISAGRAARRLILGSAENFVDKSVGECRRGLICYVLADSVKIQFKSGPQRLDDGADACLFIRVDVNVWVPAFLFVQGDKIIQRHFNSNSE